MSSPFACRSLCVLSHAPLAVRGPADDYPGDFYSLWLLYLLGSKEHARKWPQLPGEVDGQNLGHHQDTLLRVLGKYLVSSLILSVLTSLLCETRMEPLASVFNPYIPIVGHAFFKQTLKHLSSKPSVIRSLYPTASVWWPLIKIGNMTTLLFHRTSLQ